MSKKFIKCECCKKQIEDMFNRKYCGHCSNYTNKLRKKLSSYKRKFEIVNKKLYGTINGSERIRYSQTADTTEDKDED